ncbi:MAG: hypothetical protein OSJ43_06365 [Oscillospiraceae bacterium]|nr:hypothetical protein [Oscillospiraceae bacterium]
MAISTDKLQTLMQSKEQLERVKYELDKKANAADVYTKQEVDSKISSTYKAAGSVAFADLPTADETHAGYVYNITDAFTTTADFVEGAGKKHPAGTNVAIVVGAAENEYKYDVLAGFVDTSNFVEKDGSKVLSDENYTTEEKTKLGGVSEGANKVEASETLGNILINGTETTIFNVATDTENNEMLNTVFGAKSE